MSPCSRRRVRGRGRGCSRRSRARIPTRSRCRSTRRITWRRRSRGWSSPIRPSTCCMTTAASPRSRSRTASRPRSCTRFTAPSGRTCRDVLRAARPQGRRRRPEPLPGGAGARRARGGRRDRQPDRRRRLPVPARDGEAVRYIGEVGEDKLELYAGARAFLMPIRWPEPFGLVMTEAMACGTPVIAFPEGSAPELVLDGETGFVVEDEHAMAEAVRRLDEIDPARCRGSAEERFDVAPVAEAYERAYG